MGDGRAKMVSDGRSSAIVKALANRKKAGRRGNFFKFPNFFVDTPEICKYNVRVMAPRQKQGKNMRTNPIQPRPSRSRRLVSLAPPSSRAGDPNLSPHPVIHPISKITPPIPALIARHLAPIARRLMGSSRSKLVQKNRKNPHHAYPKAIFHPPTFFITQKTRKSPSMTPSSPLAGPPGAQRRVTSRRSRFSWHRRFGLQQGVVVR